MNAVWAGLILVAVVWGGLTGRMAEVTAAIFSSANSAVTLVIGLVGIMVFLLGAMRVAFDGGLREGIARVLAPVLRRLFPDVPEDHPAMSAMVMNMSSNMAGLGNAATPFGLKAMADLDRLNPHRGAATDAMVLFLAINTSAITILPPLGTIGVRVAAGSAHPEAIWLPTLIATTCSTVAAVSAFYLLRRLPRFRHRSPAGGAAPAAPPPEIELPTETPVPTAATPRSLGNRLTIWFTLGALAVGLLREASRLAQSEGPGAIVQNLLQTWLFPLLIVGLLLIGIRGRVRVYESMVAGAREGLEVAARIVPYLVGILVAVGMFRASGALDLIIGAIDPITSRIGLPAAALPMALLRPLSGSGSFAIMSETLTAYGPDSFVGYLVSTLQGSTETTFYVLALYLGAAGVRDARHALACCLIGDLAGIAGAVAACHLFFDAAL
ncbi:MAG: nucleoside recognition domain-containing protein [Deltaproteobacteria bacterium]